MLGSGGVWNSTDGGGNWTPINSDPIFDTVTMLTVDPMTPTTVYGVFGTASPALFKSIDGGAHWRRLLDQNVTALAVDPRTPTTLYVCTQATVDMLKSVNGGESWTAVTTGLPEGIGGTALVFDPATPTTLYVAMGRAGVFTSTDGGNHWSGVNNNGLSGTVAGTLAIAAPSKLYLGTLGTGVFRLF